MRYSFLALLTALLFISCTNEKIEEPVSDGSAAEVSGVPGEAYVCFSDDMVSLIENGLASGTVRTKSQELDRTFETLGITEMHRVFPHAGKFEPRTREAGLHKWYVVKFSKDIPLTKASGTFLSMEGVEIMEPVNEIRNHGFNDPEYGKLWGLNNTANPDYDINVESVWENYTTGNPDVIVCVVDEGVDINHEDLKENCLPEPDHFSAVQGVVRLVPGEHGTHVAGTIAAVGNNGVGIAGIAGGDKAKGQAGVRILSCQIFAGTSGSTDEGSARAIKEGADRGAVISQNSWGYQFDTDGDGKLTGAELEKAKNTKAKEVHKAAIDYFIKNAGYDENGNQVGPMAGGVVFFAAGNDAAEYGAPAEYEEVIAVGSIDQQGRRSTFSNYGSWVDIAAPGTGIYSTVPGGYESMNGTSMACPHVSGAAALVVSKMGGLGFTNDMLKARILGSADTELVPASYKIGGLLNVRGAMEFGKDVDVDPVTDLVARVSSNNFRLDWTVPQDSDGEAPYGYMILYGTDRTKVEEATPEDIKGLKVINYASGTGVGKPEKYVVRKLDFETGYYIKVYAYSFGRQYSDASDIVEITTLPNKAPEITVKNEGVVELKPYQKKEIIFNVSEPDRHGITSVEYVSGSKADTFKAMPDGSYCVTIVGIEAPEGTYTAKVVAKDEYGLSSTRELTYRILGNVAPEKIAELENMTFSMKNRMFTINMTDYVKDADNEPLRYEISVSDPMVLHLIANGNELIGTTLEYGVVDVEVKVKDARGEAAVFNFKIRTRRPAEEVSVYPNPVADFVNVATADEPAETRIRIVSSTGRTVYDATLNVSGFEPARIDMTSCPPGMYVVAVAFGGQEYKRNIVKL